MNTGVQFALLSLFLAGLNDVVFKRYSLVPRSRGGYVMGMGLVWALLQWISLAVEGRSVGLDGQTIAFGLGAGLFVALANICLIEGMTHVNVSLASTIYRLNTIAVVVMAALLLDEEMTAMKVAAVLLGVGAVLMLVDRKPQAERRSGFYLFFALVILASLLRAGFGVLSKVAVQRGVDLQLMLLVNAPVWIVIGAAYAAREAGIRMDWSTVRYAALSGAFIFGIANFLMLALAAGQASVVVPIANMSFLVAMLLASCLRMERMTPRKILSAGIGVLAIIFMSRAA